jgi:hypothetical protein
VVEAGERTPSVEAMRQGMIVHAANLAMLLIFVNRLLLNRKLQPPLIALDAGDHGILNFWGGARPTSGVMAGLTRPSTRFGAVDDRKRELRDQKALVLKPL